VTKGLSHPVTHSNTNKAGQAGQQTNMYQVTLRLDHDLPFSNVSKAFPEVEILRWCNREVDILEAESGGVSIDSFEVGLREAAKRLSADLIHVHRYSNKALEAVIKCRCAASNSSVAIVEASNCIPIMPVVYSGGLEHVKLFAFTKEDQKAAIENLEAISSVTVEGRGRLESHSARPAMTISIDDLIGTLTTKQLKALVEGIEMGYYSMPKKVTVEEMASRARMPRSTFEEHLRKAEVKVMRAIRPYARMGYLSSRSP
jgi:predicted DNA binding protein